MSWSVSRPLLAVLALVACNGTSGDAPKDDTEDSANTDQVSDSDTDIGPSGVPVQITESGLMVCGDPSARLGGAFDLRHSKTDGTSEVSFWGGGAGVGDMDDDGKLDVLIFAEHEVRILYQSSPDVWTSLDLVAAGPGLQRVFGGSLADYDGDDDLDLFITQYGLPNVLFENRHGVFVDVTAAAGLAGDPENHSSSSSWADFDGDGDLDLFVGGHGHVNEEVEHESNLDPPDPSQFYLNNGDGTFEDVSYLLPVEAQSGYTLVPGWIDADDDGDPDLMMINDFGRFFYMGQFLWNDAGTFRLAQPLEGLNVQLPGMGLSVGDVNGDGIPDFAVPAWRRAAYLLSDAASPGVWYDYAVDRNLWPDDDSLNQVVAWGGEFTDMDNDADLDVPMNFGYLWTNLAENTEGQPDAMFIQQPDGHFVDRGAEWGYNDGGRKRGFAIGDVNRDGWIDIVKPDLDGKHDLFLSRCGSEAWIELRLRAPAPNTRAIGAKISIFDGDHRQTRWVMAGGTSFASSSANDVHFGLGYAERVDRIEIRWPDGEVTELTDVGTRQIIDVRRLAE